MEKSQYRIQQKNAITMQYKFVVSEKRWYGWKELDFFWTRNDAEDFIRRLITVTYSTYYYDKSGQKI